MDQYTIHWFHELPKCDNKLYFCGLGLWFQVVQAVFLLYPKMPCRAEYADNFGLKPHLQRRFKFKVVCGRKWSHSFDWYLRSAAQRHVIKCALNIWMARSSIFNIWRCGGTSWYLILFFSKHYFRLDDSSLSRMWRLGRCPLVVNVVTIEIAASWIYASLRVLVGIYRMLLVS